MQNKEENIIVIHHEIHTLYTVQLCPLYRKVTAELETIKEQKKDEQRRWRGFCARKRQNILDF